MSITIPITIVDDLRIRSHALAAGFSSIEQYVQHVIEMDLADKEINQSLVTLTHDEWEHKFQELLNMAEPGNPQVDDSREGIYAERIAQLNSHAYSD